ncbi:MAG: response regulator [Eubacteriales bacterium]|nr:response regulator [Eubacteriales bacterium]
MYRMVVVDDEYIVVEGIKAMIRRQNPDYEVVGWAYDGIHALEVIREQNPDLVITDIRIPGLDGLSLVETAREFCPDTVFIVISGYTEFEYARRALALGVRGYIDKPVSMDKLDTVLKRFEREQSRSREENDSFFSKKRREHEELEKLFDKSIRSITAGEEDEFHKCADSSVEKMKELYKDLSDFRRELYKYLCVISDILIENKSQISRESLVSFKEMEKQQTIQEVCSYGERVISDISKHIAADKTGSSHRVILELLEYINEHYHEDIGLNELADRVKMSTAYLSVLFKTEVGTSYVKYLTDLRVRQAKKLLKEGYKVHEVSGMVGYSNYRYFCDIFKKHEGVTPNEYKGKIWGKS